MRLPALAEPGDPLGRRAGEALWPERWPRAFLDRRKRELDLYWWLAQYQQRPARHTRTEWPDEYFHDHIWANSWPDAFSRSAMAIDPSTGAAAGQGDYFACVFAGLSGEFIYVDALLTRARGASDIVSRAIDFALDYHPDVVGLESNAFQHLLAPEFDRQCASRRLAPLPLVELNNHQNKKNIRIPRIGPYLARHKLRLRPTPGAQLLFDQLRDFPLSDHDDGPDALEMALRLLKHTEPREEEPEEWVLS